MNFDVIIIGGGLAGLCNALHLSRKGIKVLVIEKDEYPKHKVCGEYISNEVLPYLQSLGFNPFDFGAKAITELNLSTSGSKSIKAKLPLGGFGISRYCIDAELAKAAQNYGTTFVQAKASNLLFQDDYFEVSTAEGDTFKAGFLIGAYGKRSKLDRDMERPFILKKSPFLGVKAHYAGPFPENLVGLHNFKGGYCGVSKVENDHINICYLVNYQSFKKYKSLEDFQEKVLCQNKFLQETLSQSELVFERPLTISQVSFLEKAPVENHILMCGDSAGMIHPLAGNGMGMAIRSAQILSNLILKFRAGKITSRQALEENYERQWNKEFGSRLKYGHLISRAFRMGFFSEILMTALKLIPSLLPLIVRKTHGKAMKPIA